MKPKTIQSILAAVALLAPGALFAQTSATTIPVGYTTLQLSPGLNFAGIGLHNSAVVSGTLESFTAGPNRVTDDQIDLSVFLTGGTYILEIQDGSGIIQEINSSTGTSLNVAANLSGLTYPVSYTLRKAATLAAVFGNSVATMKIDIGGGGAAGADQIWIYNGSGFTEYYYDQFFGEAEVAGWVNLDTNSLVDATTINFIYADSVVISSANGRDVVVEGEVKKGSTELNVSAGLNLVGRVAPTDTTLAEAFGSTPAQLTASGVAIGGGGAAGADQFWFYTGSGFTKIYYDEFGGLDEIAGWYNADTFAPVSSTTVLPTGYIISAAVGGNINAKVPSFYSGL